MTYWANALVRHTDKEYRRDDWVRPQFTYTAAMSFEEAKKQLETWREIYTKDNDYVKEEILIEWIEDGDGNITFFECYVDGLGNVRKPIPKK